MNHNYVQVETFQGDSDEGLQDALDQAQIATNAFLARKSDFEIQSVTAQSIYECAPHRDTEEEYWRHVITVVYRVLGQSVLE